MSMAADIASLELIAAVHQMTKMDQATFEHLVHRLEQHVAHFEWVGLYLQEKDEEPTTLSLMASAGEQSTESIARKAILQVPITGQMQQVIGRFTITSKKAIAFDESDYTSLAALAEELGKKIEQTRLKHQ
jgi:putative methionine-R-sulfoxide reductase with GAF domain